MTKSLRFRISELCYYLFFGILFFAKAVGLYDGQPVFRFCLVLAAFFVMAKMLLTNYDIREFVAVIAFTLLGMVVYKNSGEKSALIFLIMMAGLKNVPLDRIMKTGLAVWGLGFCILVMRSVFGAENEIVMAHHKFGLDLLRKGMGYSHPNVLHVSYAILVTLILFVIKNNKSRIRAVIWLMIGNVVIFLYSVSYTGFMLVTFFIAFHIYFTYRKKFSILEKILIQSVFPVSVLFSLFAPLLMEPDTPLFHFLNRALNSRFYASRLYLQENPITLFGSRIYASHTYALDSSYVTLLIYGGLVLFLSVCAGYIFAVNTGIRRKDIKALSLLLSFSIAGVIEPFLFNLSFKNLSLLVLAEYLYSLCKEGQEIKLLSGWDREICIKIPVLLQREKYETDFGEERKMAVIALIAGLAVGGCFYLTARMPTTIFVGEKFCDIEGEVIEINKMDYKGDNSVVFYGCADGIVSVYRFEGETITFERLRDAVRIVFITAFVVYIGQSAWRKYEYKRTGKEKTDPDKHCL